MGRMASSTAMASAALARQRGIIGANEVAMLRYQERMAALRAEQMRLMQIGAGVLAVGGFIAMGDALSNAGRFQLVMTSIQNVTGASATQMERLYNATMNVGDQTAMNAEQVAEMFREIARSAQGSQIGFEGMMRILPYAARMQVVLGATRGMTPAQTVDTTMALIHLFRQYYEKGTPKMMDTVLRMLELSPISPERMLRQLTYFVPILKALHTPDEQAATMMVFLARAGFGSGKGGTGVANMVMQALGPLQMTTHMQSHKRDMLVQMGFLNKDGTSPFMKVLPSGQTYNDLFGFLAKVASYAQFTKGTPDQIVKQLVGTFGVTGGRIATLMADPTLVQMLHDLENVMTNQPSLGMQQQSLSIMGTMQMQWQRMLANFNSLMIEMGVPWLRSLTNLFQSVADALHASQAWLHQHRTTEKVIGAGVFGVSTLLTGVAVAGAIGFARRILGFGAGIAGEGLAIGRMGMRPGILTGIGETLGAILTFAPVRDAAARIFRHSPGGRSFLAQGFDAATHPSVWRDMMAGLRNIPGIRQLLGVFDHLDTSARIIAIPLGIFRNLLGDLAANILRVGLRAIPFIGDILLIADAFNYFKQHPKEIGVWVGRIIYYFQSVLIPNTIHAIESWIPMILGAFANMLKAVWDMIRNPAAAVEAYRQFHQAFNDEIWRQRHVADVTAARAAEEHRKENERRYVEEQKRRRFEDDRLRRTYGKAGDIKIENLVLPGITKASDVGVSLQDAILKLTQGSPTQQTHPHIPTPLSISFGTYGGW
jgi:TP901 family phage tail tape measure protein